MLAEATTAAQSIRREVLAALHQASAATGSDFEYLLGTAMRESSLKPSAKSNSSSAAGLFQFIEQTWLGLVKQYGAKYGLGSYAGAIGKAADGHYTVADHAGRQAILALRNDPKVSALMAGESANETKAHLESRLGRDVCGGELYAAHFMGPGSACRMIELNASNPSASAAAAFPDAAEANRSVFYHPDGTAKTVREVYDWAMKQPVVSQGAVAGAGSAHVSSRAQFAWPRPAASAVSYSASVDRWPARGLFDGRDRDGTLTEAALLPRAPFVLTLGVVSLLASLTPDGDSEDHKAF